MWTVKLNSLWNYDKYMLIISFKAFVVLACALSYDLCLVIEMVYCGTV